jgi:hypothetical protein
MALSRLKLARLHMLSSKAHLAGVACALHLHFGLSELDSARARDSGHATRPTGLKAGMARPERFELPTSWFVGRAVEKWHFFWCA